MSLFNRLNSHAQFCEQVLSQLQNLNSIAVETFKDVLLLRREVNDMAKTLDDLSNDVDALAAAAQKASTDLATIKSELDAALASGDTTKISAISDRIEGITSALNAAADAAVPPTA